MIDPCAHHAHHARRAWHVWRVAGLAITGAVGCGGAAYHFISPPALDPSTLVPRTPDYLPSVDVPEPPGAALLVPALLLIALLRRVQR